MCLTIFLPDGSQIQTIRELETTLGLSVRSYHDYPDSLDESVTPDDPAGPGSGEVFILDGCLCHVDVPAYLTGALATWHDCPDWYGDYQVIMTPLVDYVSAVALLPVTGNES